MPNNWTTTISIEDDISSEQKIKIIKELSIHLEHCDDDLYAGNIADSECRILELDFYYEFLNDFLCSFSENYPDYVFRLEYLGDEKNEDKEFYSNEEYKIKNGVVIASKEI